MLVQVVALLSLGALCSSAPAPATAEEALQESRNSIGSIIRELLQDIKTLNLSEVPSVVTVEVTVDRCAQSHLKTFIATLSNLKQGDLASKFIAAKLKRISTHEKILPKDLDEECTTVQVTPDIFRETLETLLRMLSEEILKV